MSPRPYWRGYLKLSLVSCPIALHAACASSERISFRQINRKTGNRLRQQLIDEETRDPIDAHDKGRGYEIGKGQFALVELQREGKIRHIGVSNVDISELAAARRMATIISVQNRYNVSDRSSEPVLLECERNGIAFLPWSPLSAGSNAARVNGAIAKVAARHHATPSQVVLAWLLARTPVMLPIPGTSSLAHLEENLQAARLRLSVADRRALD